MRPEAAPSSPVALTLITEDGFPLGATRFRARGPRRGIVLVAPASGSPQGAYRPFAEHAAEAGWDVLTWDWRGTGASRHALPWRDTRLRLRAWGELDLAAAIAWADRHAPTEPVGLVGHAIGGQLVGLAPNASRLGALVLVAAADGWLGRLPCPLRRLRSRILWGLVVPLMARLSGRVPAAWLGVEQDLPCEVVLEWARWCRRPEYLADWRGHAALRAPVLAYSFADDAVAPHAAVAALLRRHAAADHLTHRRLTPGDLGQRAIGHHGFFRPELAQPLWRDGLAFLARCARPDS